MLILRSGPRRSCQSSRVGRGTTECRPAGSPLWAACSWEPRRGGSPPPPAPRSPLTRRFQQKTPRGRLRATCCADVHGATENITIFECQPITLRGRRQPPSQSRKLGSRSAPAASLRTAYATAIAPARLRISRWVIRLAATTESNIASDHPRSKSATGAIRMAAPMPADSCPASQGEVPRSSSATTCRNDRPTPRCAPR